MSLISYVTRIHFAENALEDALQPEMETRGLGRPLVIHDDGPARPGLTDRLLAALGSDAEPILLDVCGHAASETVCEAAAETYRSGSADGLIGFGGQSAIALAKAVGLRVTHDGPLRQFACQRGGGARIRPVIPPVIAIPTTPDACSEISPVAVVGEADGAHVSIVSPHLLPRVAVCDPSLTHDLPPDRMASAAMDILTHCIETFSATAYNPPADGIARDGLRRAMLNAECAVSGPDPQARRELMAAALDGALAAQKGLGAVHAMSHAIGSLAGGAVDHGAVNAVLLPLVLDFNAPAVAGRFEEIRRDFGLRRGADLGRAMATLRSRIGLPSRLRGLGLDAVDLDRAASAASADYFNRTNPRLAGRDDYLAMLMEAY